MSRDSQQYRPPLSIFIRQRREELHLQQAELAAMIDRLPSQLAQWESGRHVRPGTVWLPPADVLPALADALQVPVEDLVKIALGLPTEDSGADAQRAIDKAIRIVSASNATPHARSIATAGLLAAREVHSVQVSAGLAAEFRPER